MSDSSGLIKKVFLFPGFPYFPVMFPFISASRAEWQSDYEVLAQGDFKAQLTSCVGATQRLSPPCWPLVLDFPMAPPQTALRVIRGMKATLRLCPQGFVTHSMVSV